MSSAIPPTAPPGQAYDAAHGGSDDVFVAKLDGTLTQLLAATFLGGGIDGSAYVAGWTNSPDFPTTAGAFRRTYLGGRTDGFVTKLDNGLETLLASTFLGGASEDRAQAIALGAHDGVEGGRSQSGSLQGAFVSVLAPDLAVMYGSTFLGGGGGDSFGRTVAMTSDGRYGPTAIYLAGVTESAVFPTTEDAHDRTLNDQRLGQGAGICREDLSANRVGRRGDAFVAKLTGSDSILAAARLSNLAASTFVGGCAHDAAWTLALDGSGNVFVAGYTYASDFPTTPGAYDETANGDVDAFAAKLDGDLTSLLASTHLGGGRGDFALGPAVDGRGDLYVTGYTRSDGFPTTPGAYDSAHNGNLDAFVSKLSPDLGAIGID